MRADRRNQRRFVNRLQRGDRKIKRLGIEPLHGDVQVAFERQARTVITTDAEFVEAMGLATRLGKRGIGCVTEATSDNFRGIAAEAGVGVSGVDYALADTGTLVLLAGKGQARSISLLPPVHIALVKSDQIVSGLDDLFTLLRFEREDKQLTSAVTFITGPSRTADIELRLVIGVHGPQELHVVVVEK